MVRSVDMKFERLFCAATPHARLSRRLLRSVAQHGLGRPDRRGECLQGALGLGAGFQTLTLSLGMTVLTSGERKRFLRR